MIMDLEEKEQRYRFLYTKLDSELNKVKSMKQILDGKRAEVYNLVGNKQVDFSLHMGSEEDIYSQINNYIGELENLKHYLSLELEKIVRQIGLKDALKKGLGDAITVSGEDLPVVSYKDQEIADIETKYQVSKKLIDSLKSKMKDDAN